MFARHRHAARADRGSGVSRAADPEAHGHEQRRRARPDLARRTRRAQATTAAEALEGDDGGAAGIARTRQRLASRYGGPAPLSASGSVATDGAGPDGQSLFLAARTAARPLRAGRP